MPKIRIGRLPQGNERISWIKRRISRRFQERNVNDLVKGADAVIAMTPWNEFMQLDMQRIKDAMHTPVLIDGRNLYDPAAMIKIGFTYRGIGRGYNGAPLK